MSKLIDVDDQNDQRALEGLVERHSLAALLKALADIACERAKTSRQDSIMARTWKDDAIRIAAAAQTVVF